jgi:hypothetical protein
MTDYQSMMSDFANRWQVIDFTRRPRGYRTAISRDVFESVMRLLRDWGDPHRIKRFTPIQVIALSLRRASELPEEILREIMRHVMTIRRRTMNRRIRTGPPDGPDDDRRNTGPSWVDSMNQTWLWGNTNWSRHYRGWSGTSRQRRRAWQDKVITRKYDPRQPGILEALMPNLKF